MHQLPGPFPGTAGNASPWQKTPSLATQNTTAAPNAGSWDPDALWGTYGGRLYNTTLSALCLEVYYRFLPSRQLSTTRPPAAREDRLPDPP